MRSVLTVLSFLGVLALAACGDVMKDPLDGLNFHAPSGWGSIDLLGLRAFSAADSSELILVESLPADVDVEEQTWHGANIRNPRDVTRRVVKICGTTAHYESALVFVAQSFSDMRAEMVYLRQGDENVIATYLYPTNRAPNKSAEASIYELCPVKK